MSKHVLHYIIWPTRDRTVDTDIGLYFDIIDTKQNVTRKNFKHLKLAIKKYPLVPKMKPREVDRWRLQHAWQVRNAQNI
jgi:hypothetical protein